MFIFAMKIINMYSICHLSFIPIRKEPSHKSEMTSQLLFGDDFTILGTQDKWHYIENHFDSYNGWIPSQEVKILDDSDYFMLTKKQVYLQKSPIVTIQTKIGKILIGFGSRLVLINQNDFAAGELKLSVKTNDYVSEGQLLLDEAIEVAMRLKETPYLWGGRSIWGIDCSGLTQNLFRMMGIKLKRDAKDQALQGNEIKFEDRASGDLAFFHNENGNIIHVGMLLNQNEIFHASGKVRVDAFNDEGIYKAETNEFSHQLNCIRRFL